MSGRLVISAVLVRRIRVSGVVGKSNTNHTNYCAITEYTMDAIISLTPLKSSKEVLGISKRMKRQRWDRFRSTSTLNKLGGIANHEILALCHLDQEAGHLVAEGNAHTSCLSDRDELHVGLDFLVDLLCSWAGFCRRISIVWEEDFEKTDLVPGDRA